MDFDFDNCFPDAKPVDNFALPSAYSVKKSRMLRVLNLLNWRVSLVDKASAWASFNTVLELDLLSCKWLWKVKETCT